MSTFNSRGDACSSINIIDRNNYKTDNFINNSSNYITIFPLLCRWFKIQIINLSINLNSQCNTADILCWVSDQRRGMNVRGNFYFTILK